MSLLTEQEKQQLEEAIEEVALITSQTFDFLIKGRVPEKAAEYLGKYFEELVMIGFDRDKAFELVKIAATTVQSSLSKNIGAK